MNPVPGGTRTLAATAALLMSLVLGGCETTEAPVLESGPNAEVTHDGLVRVRWSRFKYVWAKPRADFGLYERVMMDPVSVAYKRPPTSGTIERDLGRGNFALSERQMDDLKRYFGEAFEKQLSKLDNFTLVDAPGSQTLRVEAAIIDLVVNVPTESSAGRDSVFTTSAAEMTLVMELRDSITGEILARVADRRDTQSGSGAISDLTYSTPAANAGALRLLFQHWAKLLASRLDAIHEAPPVGVPAGG